MKKIFFILVFAIIYSCNSSDGKTTIDPKPIVNEWTVPIGTVVGSFNLFPLALNPTFSKVSEVNFISDKALVAMISFKNEIRVYPYQYISPFECVNDTFKSNSITLSYCPITQSALCWNSKFKSDTFVLRSSGYLHHDNLVAYDGESDTYWSQMLSKCIKGKYADETNETFNFIETTWGTVKNYFPNALTFTNTSISSSKSSNDSKKTNSAKKTTIDDGEKVYGILNSIASKNSKIHIYEYDEFKDNIKLYEKFFNSENIIVIGNKELHFITSYIKDSNAIFTPVQNNFPIVMEDSDGNQWNIFGIAQSGSREGQQLQSPTGFLALWWAWNAFYDDFVFNE